jgi:RNA polymerase sigma-70 factor (sigma-E family)
VNARLDGEFREFMHARWPVMVRLAYGLTGDQGHAEDVAQAAFARAYASWPRVRRSGNPDAYVRQIVVNENRNRFRKRRVTERLTDSPPESGLVDVAWTDTTRDYDERSALIAALQRLGPRQRAVIVLRYWMDLTEHQAAAALNCSVGTVKSQASAAWVMVNQPDGTTTKVWPVTVGGQKLFAVAVEGGSPNQLTWTDYDSSGAVVGSMSG